MCGFSSVNRDIISLATEKALLEIGQDVHDLVKQRLSDDYNCSFVDCYDNPEYLHRILRDVYGNSYQIIVKSITNKLKNLVFDEKMIEFIKVLSK